MKTKLTLLALLITALSFAQNGINYKAVIKNNFGNVVANQSVKIRFTILKGAANVYQETHLTTTDANGIAIVNIGMGTPISGSFTSITWGAGAHSLKVEIDQAGGNNFVLMGTNEFKSVPYALNVTGLEAIDEGNGKGWRLKGRNLANYGNIGRDAVDLSSSYLTGDYGAIGNNSLAVGGNTEALGHYSVAFGLRTHASGAYSFSMGQQSRATSDNSFAMGLNAFATGSGSLAMGINTLASGISSTSMGGYTKATGNYSTAMGYSTEATGSESTALGYISQANGDYSTAMGRGTKAVSYGSTAIGKYNLGFASSSTVPVATDPLLEIGTGTSDAARSNALTVLKNGNVGIGSHTPVSLLEITHLNTLPTISNFRNALSIKNANSNESWQFHVDNGGTLLLYRKGAYRGYFDSSTGAYFQASDMRLKKDIIPLETNTLQKVMQLNPVSYHMIDQNNEERQIGLISQEVQKVFPSLTHLVAGQDVLALSYTELIPMLIKAIQEQQVLIDSQQTTIKNQDSKIDVLTAEFNQRLKHIETILKTSQQ